MRSLFHSCACATLACGDLSAVNLFQRLARSDIDVVSFPLSKEKCTESGLVAMKNAQKKREQVPPFK
ncbi:hypothetical protein ATN81_11185 [Agrobacterium pusense]|jgi:hypothetical protein|nr:hypothetical protein ATN81_11185 [Agrobacterium pusense]OJH59351.1 hypothetical protein BA725_12770 [Agrobacterium pusense]